MAIRYKDVAVGRNRNTSRPIERIRTIPGDALFANHHKHLAGRTQFEDFLAHHHAVGVLSRHAEHCRFIVYVAGPQVPFPIDCEAVRIGEQSRAKALQKLARRIEFQNRRIGIAPPDAGGVAGRHRVEAAMKDPDVAVAPDMHPDDFPPAAAVHALGESRPSLHEMIRVGQLPDLRPGSNHYGKRNGRCAFEGHGSSKEYSHWYRVSADLQCRSTNMNAATAGASLNIWFCIPLRRLSAPPAAPRIWNN